MSSESSKKPWQHRIGAAEGGEGHALAQAFVESISYDRRMYKHDIAGSIAHATMLAKVSLISDAERDQIIEGLKAIEKDIEADNFKFDIELEDIHMVIEAELIKRIGEPGRKLHTGRSRNDQVAQDLHLWLSDASIKLSWTVGKLVEAFVQMADRSATIVMPAYTHLQRAQPISAGAECLAWAESFAAWEARAGNLTMQGQRMVLGSGAIAGSSLPLNRFITLRCLNSDTLPTDLGDAAAIEEEERVALDGGRGTEGISRNSIHSTATRDFACDLVFVCAMIAQHLSRWAEQWIIYMTIEFSFLKIADQYTTGSSMMPQKRNPDMLELIRGRCGNVYGDLFALMTILKGLPIGYNRDLQEDKRIVFRAYDTVSSCLAMATAIVSSANYIKENIEPTLERGFLDATSLAEYFVTKGIPFRTAHQIVGSLVARCEKEGKTSLAQLRVEDFNEVISQHKTQVQVDEGVYQALGARNVVKRYRSAGAAGGKPFEDQLAAWKQRLGM